MTVRYEWDPQKAADNQRKHGVTSEQGRKALVDPFSLEKIDDRENYGEERLNLVGMCDGTLLHVTFVQRGDNIRIISVRRAERHEQDSYFREDAP